MKNLLIGSLFILLFAFTANSQTFEKDVFNTSMGDLTITFVGHGTLMMEWNGKVVHIDPVGMYADYTKMPKADLILVTHSHPDHLDVNSINAVKKEFTPVVVSQNCVDTYPSGKLMKNGDSETFDGIKVEAVPAYNLSEGTTFHPKGQGNGYVIQFGDKRVYVAGDTENIPEMAQLKNIDIAFLPMNRPYTMTPEMVADAANMFHPKILYPYHFGDTDTSKLLDLMKDQKETEVRIRKLG